MKDLAGLEEIRRERQAPAHKIEQDLPGRSFADLHDEYLNKAYVALQTLRLIMANHSETKEVEVPKWLYEGRIRLFGWKKKNG